MMSKGSIRFEDILLAFDWVNAAPPTANAAYVSRATGQTHWVSDEHDGDEAVPDDIDDATRHLAIPHRNDLDLGRRLALAFVDERLPQSYDEVSGYFRQRGAYRRFKALLERNGALDAWHAYEAKAVELALRE